MTYYNTGTISVTAGDTTVTGVGTAWQTNGIRPGDLCWRAGLSVRIAAVNSNTSLTLATGWPGSTLSGVTYEIHYAPDAARLTQVGLDLLAAFQSPALSAMKTLTPAANKGLSFTGANAAALFDQTNFGRAIQGLTGANGSFIRATGSGSAAMQTIVGATSLGAGNVPQGALVERGTNANGEYYRFAGGLQIGWLRNTNVPVGGMDWTYPASHSGQGHSVVFGMPASGAFARTMSALSISSSAASVRVRNAVDGSDVGGGASLLVVGHWHT